MYRGTYSWIKSRSIRFPAVEGTRSEKPEPKKIHQQHRGLLTMMIVLPCPSTNDIIVGRSEFGWELVLLLFYHCFLHADAQSCGSSALLFRIRASCASTRFLRMGRVAGEEKAGVSLVY